MSKPAKARTAVILEIRCCNILVNVVLHLIASDCNPGNRGVGAAVMSSPRSESIIYPFRSSVNTQEIGRLAQAFTNTKAGAL